MVLSGQEVTGEVLPHTIIKNYTSTHDNGIELVVEADNGDVENITTTAEHPFYVMDKGWTPASELKDGDLLKTASGFVKLTGSTWIQGSIVTRNLNVDVFDTFYVGELQLWVHNCDHEKVYHGTTTDQTITSKGLNTADRDKVAGGKDFVETKGLSTTTDKATAQKWANARAQERGKKPVVLEAKKSDLPKERDRVGEAKDQKEYRIDVEDYGKVGPGVFKESTK